MALLQRQRPQAEACATILPRVHELASRPENMTLCRPPGAEILAEVQIPVHRVAIEFALKPIRHRSPVVFRNAARDTNLVTRDTTRAFARNEFALMSPCQLIP